MLEFFTIAVVLAVGYVYFSEGVFTAFVMLCGVILAGLVAFNFFEPIAGWLGGVLGKSFLTDYEDALAMVGLFAITLGLFRTAANNISPSQIEYHPLLQSVGGAVFGMATGYLVAGFLVCALQTLPWKQNFMGFDARYQADQPMRRWLPADRAWLAMMHRAGAYAFSNDEVKHFGRPPEDESYYDRYKTFDKFGNFEQRYARFRRFREEGTRDQHQGEYAAQLGK